MSKKDFPSELRFDVASKDWVVIATGRAKRPDSFKKEAKKIERTPPEECPFCKINTQKPATIVFAQGKEVKLEKGREVPENWTTVSIPNKYPAFRPTGEIQEKERGPMYKKMNAVGFHEVVVTRNHDDPMGILPLKRVEELIEIYHRRYTSMMEKPFVNYIAIFQNHGAEAGASIYHPHSQIITTPLIDTDLKTALYNSRKYHQNNEGCVYCEMMKWEMKTKKRIIFENDEFLVLCPFASKVAFEVIITPKKHASCFASATKKQRRSLAEAFKQGLGRLYTGLNNPPYNFYLHSAPQDEKTHPYYHWHWTILPKTSTQAGFELGAGMEISVIEPEKAAAYLKKQPLK